MSDYIKIIFIIILIFSIGLSACKKEPKAPAKKEVTTKVTSKKETPKPIPKKKLEPVIEKVPNKYFLIMASFQNPDNAERLQKELTSEGYISEVHIATNGFHRVSYKAFSDRKLAFQELESARSTEVTKDSWLYIKR